MAIGPDENAPSYTNEVTAIPANSIEIVTNLSFVTKIIIHHAVGAELKMHGISFGKITEDEQLFDFTEMIQNYIEDAMIYYCAVKYKEATNKHIYFVSKITQAEIFVAVANKIADELHPIKQKWNFPAGEPEQRPLKYRGLDTSRVREIYLCDTHLVSQPELISYEVQYVV